MNRYTHPTTTLMVPHWWFVACAAQRCSFLCYLAGAVAGCSLLLVHPTAAVAADTASADASKPVLQAGTEAREKMQNSVKVIVRPPSKPKPAMFNLGSQTQQVKSHVKSDVQQLSGSQSYSPGTAAPPVPKPVIHDLGVQNFGGNFGPRFSAPALIPARPAPLLPAPVPKWNYTMTPKNGVMSWSPGYGTTIVTRQRNLDTFASKYRTNALLSSPRVNALLAQPRTNAQLSNAAAAASLGNKELNGLRLPSSAAPPPPELKAKQMSLPEKHLAPPLSWDEWYQRIAKAVYAQWQQNSAGSGSSTLLITVFNTKYVDCRVVSFDPGAGASRNGDAESIFREASLKAITSLNGDDVWEFPVSQKPPKKIVFDMKLTHAVGVTPGCEVIHMHTDNSMKDLQK